MEEIFYEDILETFLFCFFASLGIIQIMVARRGWHGLSVYGGRVRSNVNNALGTALLIFAFSWYFGDPLHRNVRNIEAFMSLVCLVLGIVAAGAATAFLAALSEALRRRFGRGKAGRRSGAGSSLESVHLPGGVALISEAWGGRGENLVVVAEPGRGSQSLMRRLHAALPQGRRLLSLHPRPREDGGQPLYPQAAGPMILESLARVEQERGIDLEGETFLGLGWGSHALSMLCPELENKYLPRGLSLVAPVVPDCEQACVGDALLSNTPLDIAVTLAGQKPWKEADFGRMIRLWLPVFALCVVAATAVTVAFDVRWKLISGPMVGLLISLWATYFLARWRGGGVKDSMESRLVSLLCSPAPPGGAGVPLTIVFTSGDPASLATLPAETRSAFDSHRLELWEDVLRGKFVLGEGTLEHLVALIWEERSGDEME